MRKHLDYGCPDCFDEPPAVVGWDLGFPDVTSSTFKPEVYSWQYKEEGRDNYCPGCFDAPTSETPPLLPSFVMSPQSSPRLYKRFLALFLIV